VRLQVDDAVASVTLDRPARLNAQTPAMWAELVRIGERLPSTVRAVVVRGAGPAFSAGLDRSVLANDAADQTLTRLADADLETATEMIGRFQAAFGWLARPDIVSIAVVHGHAIGAGFQLALACDLRVLVDDARLAMAEVTLGLVPDLGGTRRLRDLVGYSRAAELCLTGRTVDAAEAHEIGLASLVVSREQVEISVRRTLAAVLAPTRAAQTATKQLLLAAGDRTQSEQQVAEAVAQHRRLREMIGRIGPSGIPS